MDLDGDGKTEILSGSWPGEIYLFQRKPNGTFAAGEKLKNKSGSLIKVGSASALAVADWDDDGDLDLIVGNIDGAVFRLTNEGTPQKPSFGVAEQLQIKGRPLKVDSDAGPAIADWDGDGKLDLLLGSGAGGVVWCRNVGTKNKPELAAPVALIEGSSRTHRIPPAATDANSCGMRTKVAVVDWNGDGRTDLLVGDFHSGGPKNYHGWVWVYLRKANEGVTAQTGK